MVVEIIGDASSLEKSYRRSAQATNKFGREIQRTSRGAVAASLSFKGLGRSVGFASAAFLGGAGFTAALKSTITAAEEAQVAQAQLGAALDNVGLNTDANRAAIERRTQALSQMSGFDDELATQTFTRLVRATGNVTKALNLNVLAADVARARGTSLEEATQLVTKALLGQAGALRRVGIAADQGASSTQLLDLLQRKFSGSAKAYGDTAAGAQERFQVALENTQEMIGAKLLPKMTEVLNKAADFLNSTDNQRQASKALDTGTKDSTKFLGFLADHYTDIKRTALFATTAQRFWAEQTVRGTAAAAEFATSLEGSNHLLDAQTQKLKDAAAAAESASKSVGSLSDELKKLAGAVTTTAGADFSAAIKGVQSLLGSTFTLTAAQKLDLAFAGHPDSPALIRAERDKQQRRLAFAMKQINAGDVRFLGEAKDAARQVAGFNSQLASIAEDNARKAQAAAERARKARAKALAATQKMFQFGPATTPGEGLSLAEGRRKFRAAASAKRQAALFRGLGLTATGDERAPTRGNLLAQLRAAEGAVEGTALDTKQLASKFAFLRNTLNTGFKGLTADTKKRVAEWLDALAGKTAGGPATRTQAASLSKLVAGVGLGPAGLRQLEFNLAGAHLTTTPSGVRGGVTHVHTTVNLDGREVARNTTEHQQRDRHRRPTQTRGRPLP